MQQEQTQAKQLIITLKGGQKIVVREHDAIMDNGARVLFIDGDNKGANNLNSVVINEQAWERVKSYFVPITYESFYGKKPLMTGILMYKLNINFSKFPS